MEHNLSGVGVLDKSVRILAALAGAEPRSLAELCATTGLPRATAHRLAHALAVHGFTSFDGASERWTLGGRCAALASAGCEDLATLARPALERLRDDTGESTQLYLPRDAHRVCAVSLESPHSLRTMVAVGALLPLDRGSAGKVLSGDAPSIQRGWAESVEEREAGVASVSSPVLRDGHVVAAVSVSGPVERTTRQPGRRYAAAVLAAARAVEAAAGW